MSSVVADTGASDRIAARFLVSGTVQGVWYRASTKQQAEALGLHGYARNLPDGRVEVLAIGTAAAIDELERWLWRGPERAVVAGVTRETAQDSGETGFRTG